MKPHWTHTHKWERYVILVKEPRIAAYLPETALLNKKNLSDYIQRYPTVFLKPIWGTGGEGIIKISRGNKQLMVEYVKHNKTQKAIYQSMDSLRRDVVKLVKKEEYMLQQGLDLVRINNRPIDFRVMLLKPYHKWEAMGIMGKVAGRDMIVTNRARGGKPIRFEEAIKRTIGYSDERIEELKKELYQMGIIAGERLGREYRGVREVGMDVVIDKDHRLWILETNAMPHYRLFLQHEDKTLYKRIDRYIRFIRRNYKNKRL